MAAAARRMFEQQQQQEAANQSPAGRPQLRSVGGGGGASPRGGGGGRRPTPAAKSVNTVIAWIRYREACQAVKKLHDAKHAQVIQLEFRDYLRRSSGVRQLRRRHRQEEAERIRRFTAHIVQNLRTNGRRICGEEAAHFANILRLAYGERSDFLEANEAKTRGQIEASFTAKAKDLYDKEAPDELKSETVPGQEFRDRTHNEAFYYFTLRRMFQEHLVGMSVIHLGHQQDGRLQIVAEEVDIRYEIVAESRHDFVVVRLQEEQQIESELRAMYTSQREQHVASMAVRRASLARDILMGPEVQGEGGARALLYQREHQGFLRLHKGFCDEWIILASSDLFLEEARLRIGAGGIVAQEHKQWTVIHRSLMAVKIQRLQDDEEESIHCEVGARRAIGWDESKKRYELQQARTATMFTLFLPLEEEAARRRLYTGEFLEYRRILSSPQLTLVVEKVMEPASRRAIYSAWCRGTTSDLFHFASIGVVGEESRSRLYLRLMQQVQFEFFQSLEYLHFLEIKERAMLEGVVRRVWERMRRSLAVDATATTTTTTQSRRPQGVNPSSPSLRSPISAASTGSRNEFDTAAAALHQQEQQHQHQVRSPGSTASSRSGAAPSYFSPPASPSPHRNNHPHLDGISDIYSSPPLAHHGSPSSHRQQQQHYNSPSPSGGGVRSPHAHLSLSPALASMVSKPSTLGGGGSGVGGGVSSSPQRAVSHHGNISARVDPYGM